MTLTLKEVEHIALLARLELSDAEKQRYQQQLSHILEHVAQLQKLDTSHTEPAPGALPKGARLRADEPKPGLTAGQVLENAPSTKKKPVPRAASDGMMGMAELTDLTVKECLQALTQGKASSVELTRAYLKRIDALEPQLHAFITLTPEKALQTAKDADEKRARLAKSGEDIPALLGLPLAIKDVLCLAGTRATCGSKILENFVPPFNATAVQKLLDAGVVPLGKTNTDEFAMGSSTENSAYGVTHNPWDLTRVPGGSSGGSAAAAAARLAPAALGTDTGGSVRQPASFCGVTGIKPTYGRVSRYGLIAYGSSLDSIGVLARTAEDAEIIFRLMAGFDERDATSSDAPVADAVCGEHTIHQRPAHRRAQRVFHLRHPAGSGKRGARSDQGL